MTEITTEYAIKWFENRKAGITMPGAKAMYDKAIAALRAQQEAEKNDLMTLEADRDAWKRRAEAAERDMEAIMKDSEQGCDYCKNYADDCGTRCRCTWDDCKPEWRGPCKENGGTDNHDEKNS